MYDNVCKSIFENSQMAIGYHRIICDAAGRPVDYEFIEVNPAYEKLTSLSAHSIIGKRISEIIPDIGANQFDWIGTYGEVALKGGTRVFRQFFDGVHVYFDLEIFSPAKNHFVTMFRDAKSTFHFNEANKTDQILLGDIIDLAEIQSVVNELYNITHIAMAIGDLEGNLLVQSGFQEICQNFHRQNARSCQNCTISDTKLFQSALSGDFLQYKCLNNMWDISTPIMVGGHVIGAIYMGQFIYEDDQIDYKLFRQQAREYGFDEEKYLQALDRVPRISHQEIESIMSFYKRFANMVALLGYKNINLLRAKTDQEALVESLKQSDNLIKDMGVVAQIGGWEFDPVSGKGTWTEEVAKIHDLSPIDATNIELGLSFYVDDSRTKINQAIKAAVEQAKPYDIELEMLTAKGVRKWVRTIGLPTVVNGIVVRVHGSFQDITASKTAEQQMQESEARYYNLLEVAPVGIIVLEDEKIVYMNPTAVEILGAASHRQLIGKSFFTVIDPDQVAKSRDQLERMMAGEKGIFPVENVYNRLDGMTIPVEVMATTLSFQGRPAVQVIITDITDRLKAKVAVEKLQIELEQMVEVRTRQLSDANKELDAFTYSVSHDLKAPLRGIDGYSKLLLEENEDQLNPDGLFFLHAIRQSVLRMNQLINDLLVYSRIERKPWQQERIDLNKLAQETVDELAVEFLSAGGQIKIDIQEATVNTSREGLYMVLKNLVENAIKYSPDTDGAIIEISTVKEENSITILVEDNGIGFDMTYHDKIFNIFERLHRTEDYPGTGIGLAIVKKVAERLKGKVWATSQPGQGSTFYFQIPKEE